MAETEQARRSGGCLCGAVRYEVCGPLRDVLICHCSQCRRVHGTPAAFSGAPEERFRLLEARGLAWYRSSDIAERGFCRDCGSSLFWRPLGKGRLSFTPGSLDDGHGLRCSAHVFTASKGDYYEIPEDGLRRFPEWSS
jgi:hypothetical protein